MRFPTVQGSNLAGRRFKLPHEFEGELNLVVLAYLQQQQADVDTWGPILAILARRHKGFRYYELPTLGRYSWLQQLAIDGGMRMGIPDRAVRERTITLYLDVAEFNAQLGIAGVGSIQSLLVDRAGTIHWRATGRYSAEKGAELTQHVERLLSPQPATL
jgi:hypothetical protein